MPLPVVWRTRFQIWTDREMRAIWIIPLMVNLVAAIISYARESFEFTVLHVTLVIFCILEGTKDA